MILEKFITSEFDNQIIFINPNLTFGELKKYVYGQKLEFEKQNINNVVLLCENYIDFFINFFAAVFSDKKIHLVTDRTRLEQLDFEYILPQKAKAIEGLFLKAPPAKDIMINLFTSGSTGIPKNIGKTLYNLQAEAQSAINEFNLTNNKYTIVSTTSSAHSYGFTFNFIMPMLAGFAINSQRIEFPEQLNIKEEYILISTPSFLEKLAKYNFKFLNSPAKILLAGAKLKDETYEYFSEQSDVIDIYGSTETGDIAYKRGGDAFTVFSDVDVDCTPNNQIIVKSDFFPQENQILNDVIKKVSNRKFILQKRCDRIVKIQEKRISLDELENNLKKHPEIEDCRCLKYNDKLCCAVVCKSPKIKNTELKNFISNYNEVIPKKWRYLDEIPKTAGGKIDNEKLKRIFSSNLSMPFVFSRKITSENAEIEMLFKESSNFFNGHFENMPILPGVVQLYYAKYFADEVFGIKLSHKEARKIKFSHIIKPDIPITLRLKNNEKNVEYTYLSDDKIFSSGIFVK